MKVKNLILSELYFDFFAGRNFIPIAASPATFHTEDVKQRNETMYIPLTDDVLVNVRTIEQISYDAGGFFIGDHKGNYVRNSQG